jgi:hypothetical protein
MVSVAIREPEPLVRLVYFTGVPLEYRLSSRAVGLIAKEVRHEETSMAGLGKPAAGTNGSRAANETLKRKNSINVTFARLSKRW